MNQALRNRLLLLAAALLFSTGGAAVKAATLNGWQVASLRSGVAALALWTLVPDARRGWTWRVWPAGVAYAVTLVLFVVANRLTTAANAIFLQATAPLYLLLFGPLLLHERLRGPDLFLVAAVGIGMAMFFLGAQPVAATAPNPPLGNLLAAITGLTWAATLTALRWLGRHQHESGATATVAAGNLIGFLAALPMALPIPHITASDTAVILYLGVFQIGLAYRCVTLAIRHVPAFEATALLLLEPALNPVWAWIVQGERPGVWAVAGGGLILSATVVKTWWQSRIETRKTTDYADRS